MSHDRVEVKVENFFLQFTKHLYRKGEMVLEPDQNPLGAYYLKKGYVREYSISPQGIEITLHIFSPRSYFPMMWVMAEIPNRYYYDALTDVELYSAPKEKILLFLNENPDVLWNLNQRLFMGLDKLIARIEYLAYGKAYEKVVSILLYLARHFGEVKNDKVYINQKFTHRDIGSLAAISRETASREWEKLEKSKLITMENQTIIIPDIRRLQQELSTY